MKKNPIIVIALSLFVLASCSGGGGGGGDDPVVDHTINSEEELLQALNFSSSEFLQINEISGKKQFVYECSPLIYHEKESRETFVTKNGQTYWKYSYEDPTWYRKKGKEDDFANSHYFGEYYFDLLFKNGLKYADLTYDTSNEQYLWKGHMGEGETLDVTFKFDDKRLVRYDFLSEGHREVTFTYLEKSPSLPQEVVSEYQANATDGEHIAFTKDGNEITNLAVLDNEDFVFEAKVINDTSSVYKIPNRLAIKINGVAISNQYHIDFGGDTSHRTATITIDKEAINGDIDITGSAISDLQYFYIIPYAGGVTVKKDNFKVTFGVATKTEPLVLTLIPDDIALTGYVLEENIYIYVNDELVWPAEEKPADITYVIDEITKIVTLTINTDINTDTIAIVMRSNKYRVLDDLDWEEIATISQQGYAKALFYLGETKKIKLNNGEENFVRIIGFDHDHVTSSSSKAGITFEFAYLLNTNVYQYGEDSRDYPSSELNNTLNGDQKDSIYNLLPEGLQKSLRLVDKTVLHVNAIDQHEMTTYQCKLFPLSLKEMCDLALFDEWTEGEYYQYYKEGGKIVKYAQSHLFPSPYWLRSPFDDDANAFVISIEGKPVISKTISPHYIAPAFCI